MHKPMTEEELAAHDGISPEDKILIEAAVGQHFDSRDADSRVVSLRGFLVGQWEELEADDKLREDLPMMAASWSDGWSFCLKYQTK